MLSPRTQAADQPQLQILRLVLSVYGVTVGAVALVKVESASTDIPSGDARVTATRTTTNLSMPTAAGAAAAARQVQRQTDLILSTAHDLQVQHWGQCRPAAGPTSHRLWGEHESTGTRRARASGGFGRGPAPTGRSPAADRVTWTPSRPARCCWVLGGCMPRRSRLSCSPWSHRHSSPVHWHSICADPMSVYRPRVPSSSAQDCLYKADDLGIC